MSIPASDDVRIVLRVITDTDAGPRLFSKSEITLGSGEHCDVRLGSDADAVHCIVARTRHGYLVEDLRTKEGTRVGGKPITQAFVEPGVPVQVGWTTFVLIDPERPGPIAEFVDDRPGLLHGV